jgi:hypothetical protein
MLGTNLLAETGKISPATDVTHPFYNMAQTADEAWHTFRVYRQGAGLAGFQIDDNAVETTNQNVPSASLPPFIMAYTEASQCIVDVDWTESGSGQEQIL